MNNAAKAVASKFVAANAGYTVSDHGLVMTVRKFGEIVGAVSKNGDAWTSVVERGATSPAKTLTAALMNIHAAVEAEEAARAADEQTIENMIDAQSDEIEAAEQTIADLVTLDMIPQDSPALAPKRSALASSLMYGMSTQTAIPLVRTQPQRPSLPVSIGVTRQMKSTSKRETDELS